MRNSTFISFSLAALATVLLPGEAPAPAGASRILDWVGDSPPSSEAIAGSPVLNVGNAHVRLVSFGDVDEEFAATEGEGDGSLAYWRRAHTAFFGRVVARLGGRLDNASVIVCERFRLLCRADGRPIGGDR